jgi:hypothetical protein
MDARPCARRFETLPAAPRGAGREAMSNREWTAIAVAALAALTHLALPARADSMGSLSCVGTFGAFSCVAIHRKNVGDPHAKTVAEPDAAREKAESEKREKRWLARCHPTVRQDRYGVERYVYAAPGCEYGRYQ